MLICCKIWIMHVMVGLKEKNVTIHEKLGAKGIHCLLLESIDDRSYHFVV